MPNNMKIDITKKLRPLLKSVRSATNTAKTEVRKAFNDAGQTLRDIESGKLKIVLTITKK